MRQLTLLFVFGILFCQCANEHKADPTPNLPVENSFSVEGRELTIFTTADQTDLRLKKVGKARFKQAKQPLESEVSIFISPNKTFQEFIGIGGAITDASAEVFSKLPSEKQEELLEAYYNPEKGIGYSLMRTTIHSCDFSSESYTYVSDNDKELKTFDISHDLEYRIPMIKKIPQCMDQVSTAQTIPHRLFTSAIGAPTSKIRVRTPIPKNNQVCR